jgi:hypothetical protein
MGNRVKRVKTSVSEAQMAQAIIESWQELFGTTPSKSQVAIILSQNALETGHRNSMWNFNIGNITTDGKGPYDFFDDLPTQEQVKPGKWVKMNLKYRAYPSLKEGTKDYLKLLKRRYPNAWENIINPDPAAFSKALKQRGYYTANEAPYTKSLSKLYDKFNKSDSYEVARSGNVPTSNVSMLAENKKPQSKPLDNILDQYIKLVAASEKQNKNLYRKYLPYTNAIIVVQASDYIDGVEFANVLCSVLEEELFAKAHTHTDGQNIEVECSLPGPSQECLMLTQEIVNSTTEAFENATKKLGGIKVSASLISNKKSSYKPITFKVADSQHRKFLLKFTQG